MRSEPPPPRPARRDTDPLEIVTTVAQPARVQSYLAGGDAHFAVDRQLGDYLISTSPRSDDGDLVVDIGRDAAESHLGFTARVVSYLVTEAGLRQFLCFGATLPMLDRVHAIAQQTAPESRVVYVGRDPVVLAHAHTLRKSAPDGTTTYVDGGLRDLQPVLREAERTLDLAQPVGVLLMAVLNLVSDERDPYATVARLMDAVPSGSYLAVAHPTADLWSQSPAVAARLSEEMQRPFVLRTHAEVTRFFDGLELVEDGVVGIDAWRRPDDDPLPPSRDIISIYGGVARKP